MEDGVKTEEYSNIGKEIAEAEKKLKRLRDSQQESGRKVEKASIIRDNAKTEKDAADEAARKAKIENDSAK
jgi:hypothetical protein